MNLNQNQIKYLESIGWIVSCETPFEIESMDEKRSTATLDAAEFIVQALLKDMPIEQPEILFAFEDLTDKGLSRISELMTYLGAVTYYSGYVDNIVSKNYLWQSLVESIKFKIEPRIKYLMEMEGLEYEPIILPKTQSPQDYEIAYDIFISNFEISLINREPDFE